LIRAVGEPTRQRFWTRLAPPDLATADLRYPSAEVFLTELAEFADAVSRGDYLDEEAQTYYGDDPADREYHFGHYDLEDHQGMQRLKSFLAEADSYFQAGRFDTAAQAYEQLIAMTLKADAYETLGVDAPLSELAQDEEQLVKHYFQALLTSHPSAEALEHGLAGLAR
jgi:tetratricopeptide (TPR) repeat protein